MKTILHMSLVLLLAAAGCAGSDSPGDPLDAATGDPDASEPVVDASVIPDANEHLGDPCSTSSECEGGFCVDGPEGPVCSFGCEDECPVGFACRVTDVNGDLVSLCLPIVVKNCVPCTADDQCPGGACIELEGAGYCVQGCFEGACPPGTTCEDDPTGVHPGPFCIPDTGSCSCGVSNAGALRTCEMMNGVGTCFGVETCDPAQGWTGCTAPTPAAEICDGLDNDCNFLIDDGVDGNACANDVPGVGSCPGVTLCTGAGGLICQGQIPSAEICNYADDDCDTMIDEGFPGLGDVCSPGVGACQRFGVVRCTTSGAATECSVTAGPMGVETCNGIDDDCDGPIDEDFALGASCTAGTGICERIGQTVCAAGGGTACSATPGLPFPFETCNGLDDTCDGTVDEGFLNPGNGLYDQDFACGGCGVDCTVIFGLPNASGDCAVIAGDPLCQMTCDPGAFDLNLVVADGCEFILDPGAIYVSTGDPAAANDASCGLGPVGTGPGHHPCLTIAQGLARATITGRARVLVANGIYAEAVTLVNGKSLLGGFRRDTWDRDVAATGTIIDGVSVSGNHDRTVVASGITAATVFQGFVVNGSVNGKASGNSYAIYVSGSNGNLSILDNVIVGGRGGPGGVGGLGGDGLLGVNGSGRAADPVGYDAKTTTGAGQCNAANNRTFVNGGVRSCGGDVVSGGSGGPIACPTAQTLIEQSGDDGVVGQAGVGGSGGAGGAGADAGDDMRLESNGTLCFVPTDPDYGEDGVNGVNGTSGGTVAGCVAGAAPGSVSGGHWVGGLGPAGVAGGNGGGGGGGGAGGGAFCLSCPGGKDNLGGHGGGGGSGGCGGAGGGAAAAGGGAFGIFVTGGSAPVITGNLILRGEGGLGANGGAGGQGGQGGVGADGGTSVIFCAGPGGRGGNGGTGGHGSGGGGGCGGTSVGIYTFGVGTPNYCMAPAGNAFNGGAAGAGGAGGFSLINPGGAGATGVISPCSFN